VQISSVPGSGTITTAKERRTLEVVAAAGLLLVGWIWYVERGNRTKYPPPVSRSRARVSEDASGSTIVDAASLEVVARKVAELEAAQSALRLEWTNAQLQLDRIAKRLARYAGDPHDVVPALPSGDGGAATVPRRRSLSFAEVTGASRNDP